MMTLKNLSNLVQWRNFLVVQWLRFHTPNLGDLGTILGQRTLQIPHAAKKKKDPEHHIYRSRMTQRLKRPRRQLRPSAIKQQLHRWLGVKESACQCRGHGFNPRIRKIPWRRTGNPLQYSCLENPMDRGAWRAIQSMGSGSWTHLSMHTPSNKYFFKVSWKQ